jgi:Ribose/xylose/arabinose/galactoside ABC-type transport systems, permease components
MSTETPPTTARKPTAMRRWISAAVSASARNPTAGPLAALIVAVVAFSATTDTFLQPGNLSLLFQQSLVVGVLALGQTLVILTAGIDLANSAITVLGTLVIARYALHTDPVLALLLGLAVCTVFGLVSGLLVTRFTLPPFIVTLGLLAVITAISRLFAGSQTYTVTSDTVTVFGSGFTLGGTLLTYGSVALLVLYAAAWYALTQTSWGSHVYAAGDNPEAARLTGIHVNRVLLSVYAAAGLSYGMAAWLALGRIPVADPNAFQTANLDSITAVVIGGTSLFGGRGSVIGTLVGTLIVGVLRSGLTQAGIDSLYQDIATGLLVIAAVIFDRMTRGRPA